jgi:hypothetical protein
MGADRSRTVEASGEILTRYQGEGYEFVTIPQMLERDRSADAVMLAVRSY